MADTDRELKRHSYLLVPEKSQNRVVQIIELGEKHIVVEEADTRTRWTLQRGPFEQRLRDGQIVEVIPRWEPAGEKAHA